MKKFRQALVDELKNIPPENTKSLIEKLVVGFLTFAEHNVLLARYLWLNRHNEFISGKLSAPTSVGFDELGRLLTKHLRVAMDKKELPRVKAHVIWSILFGIPVSYIRDWLDGFAPENPTSIAPLLATACYSALQGVKP
jgi:hypothetical protein